jgi:hypothetical protein
MYLLKVQYFEGIALSKALRKIRVPPKLIVIFMLDPESPEDEDSLTCLNLVKYN